MAFDETYRNFVASCPEATLWHDPDFLSCFGTSVKTGNWSYVSLETGGHTTAVLPYYCKKRLDGWVVTLPPLIRYCSPLFATYPTRPGELLEQVQTLLAKLPSHFRSVDLAFDPQLTAQLQEDFLASDTEGELRLGSYTCEARATYFVDLSGDEDSLRQRISKSKRRQLKKAAAHWETRNGALNEEALQVLASPFTSRGQSAPYQEAELVAAFELLRARGQAASQQAFDENGELSAVSVAFKDSHRIYCLSSGSLPTAKKAAGGSWVLYSDLCWGQTQAAPEADFLGSDLPGPAKNRQELGGVKRPYLHLSHDRAWWAALKRRWR